MTTAVSEILKQAEQFSPDDQLELATRLMEQARQTKEATPHNGCQSESLDAELSQTGVGGSVSENDEDEGWLEVFSLNHAPPKASYLIKVKFVDGGRGQPRRYDFGDLFDDEEEGESRV